LSEIRRRRSYPRMTNTDSSRKLDRGDHKEVDGAEASRKIAQERVPRLARPRSTLGHVLCYRRLRDLDPELQQLPASSADEVLGKDRACGIRQRIPCAETRFWRQFASGRPDLERRPSRIGLAAQRSTDKLATDISFGHYFETDAEVVFVW